jgi:hypothetical protein
MQAANYKCGPHLYLRVPSMQALVGQAALLCRLSSGVATAAAPLTAAGAALQVDRALARKLSCLAVNDKGARAGCGGGHGEGSKAHAK